MATHGKALIQELIKEVIEELYADSQKYARMRRYLDGGMVSVGTYWDHIDIPVNKINPPLNAEEIANVKKLNNGDDDSIYGVLVDFTGVSIGVGDFAGEFSVDDVVVKEDVIFPEIRSTPIFTKGTTFSWEEAKNWLTDDMKGKIVSVDEFLYNSINKYINTKKFKDSQY